MKTPSKRQYVRRPHDNWRKLDLAGHAKELLELEARLWATGALEYRMKFREYTAKHGEAFAHEYLNFSRGVVFCRRMTVHWALERMTSQRLRIAKLLRHVRREWREEQAQKAEKRDRAEQSAAARN